jgi:hypothetical protein
MVKGCFADFAELFFSAGKKTPIKGDGGKRFGKM